MAQKQHQTRLFFRYFFSKELGISHGAMSAVGRALPLEIYKLMTKRVLAHRLVMNMIHICWMNDAEFLTSVHSTQL